MATHIRTVGVIGAGVIGSSWSIFFLSRSLRVIVADPTPGADLLPIWPTSGLQCSGQGFTRMRRSTITDSWTASSITSGELTLYKKYVFWKLQEQQVESCFNEVYNLVARGCSKWREIFFLSTSDTAVFCGRAMLRTRWGRMFLGHHFSPPCFRLGEKVRLTVIYWLKLKGYPAIAFWSRINDCRLVRLLFRFQLQVSSAASTCARPLLAPDNPLSQSPA